MGNEPLSLWQRRLAEVEAVLPTLSTQEEIEVAQMRRDKALMGLRRAQAEEQAWNAEWRSWVRHQTLRLP